VPADASYLKPQSSESHTSARNERDQPHVAEELLTSGYGFFDSGEIDKIISSNAENVRNDNSKKKFKPPQGTKLEAV